MSLTVAVAVVALAQTTTLAQTDSVTGADIRAAFAGIVQVDARARPDGDTVLFLSTPRPPDDHLLAQFYDSYLGWFVYLLHNARSFRLPGVDEPDSGLARPGREAAVSLSREFLRRLAADSQFNDVVLPVIAAHLRRSGMPVDATLLEVSRDTILLDQAMLVAVRFFFPDMIVDDHIQIHVCSQLNAVKELPMRNPALEATAFSAIMAQLRQGESTQMYADLVSARDLMKRLDMPGPDDVRLNRAQGVMWGAMFRSTGLREILLAEAQRMQDILPFAIGLQ